VKVRGTQPRIISSPYSFVPWVHVLRIV
jgi:hypothetical protein